MDSLHLYSLISRLSRCKVACNPFGKNRVGSIFPKSAYSGENKTTLIENFNLPQETSSGKKISIKGEAYLPFMHP
ncbi:MAG: hypothetical protein ABJE63_04635 [Lentilitoribacter sp.]